MLRQPHRSSAGEASEGWSVGQSRSISSLCAVYRREPPRGGWADGGGRGQWWGWSGCGMFSSESAKCSTTWRNTRATSADGPSASPLPCSLYSPSGSRAHFQPKGQGWAVHLLDFELHLVSSGQNAQPTPTFQELHSSVAGLWGPMNYKKEFIVCSLGRPWDFVPSGEMYCIMIQREKPSV